MAKKYSATEYALFLLKNRGQTEFEIKTKLARKGFEPDDIAKTVAWLKESKLVDDEHFAHNYALDKVRIYRRGKFRIGLELSKKGINKELIARVTSGIKIEDEAAAAQSLLQSKQRQWQGLDSQKKYFRSVSLLARRGFSPEIIRATVKRNAE